MARVYKKILLNKNLYLGLLKSNRHEFLDKRLIYNILQHKDVPAYRRNKTRKLLIPMFVFTRFKQRTQNFKSTLSYIHP